MTVKISKNLDRRIKVLRNELRYLTTMKANKVLHKVDCSKIADVKQQLKECHRLLKTELVNAPIERLL